MRARHAPGCACSQATRIYVRAHLRPEARQRRQPRDERSSPKAGPGRTACLGGGIDDLPTSELLDPPLATVRLDGRPVGRALMARLVGRERTDYAGPVELVEQTSLRPPLFR